MMMHRYRLPALIREAILAFSNRGRAMFSAQRRITLAGKRAAHEVHG